MIRSKVAVDAKPNDLLSRGGDGALLETYLGTPHRPARGITKQSHP